jgi:hypothetical protein
MRFSVIFTDSKVDGSKAGRHIPASASEQLERTEGKDSHPYTYLDGIKEGADHGKWIGILDEEELDDLFLMNGLYIADKTAGAVGAPGFGPFHVPSIGITTDHPPEGSINVSAYVTPMPETSKDTLEERDFRRIREAFINHFELM